MANFEQFRTWAAEGESEKQEFKTSTGQRTETAKTVCAMLNASGGRILIGVQPSGEIVGQDVSDKTLADLSHEIQQIEPPAFPSIERVPLEGTNEAIVLHIARGIRRPYRFRGKPYRRVGTTNLEIPAEETERILLERLHSASPWENEAAENWTTNDLDNEEIVRTVEEAVRRGRLADPGTRLILDLLRGLGLLRPDGKLRRAAIVLFGKEDRFLPDYPQCLLRVARFKGVDKSEFLDNRQYYGNAFHLLLRAERFMRDHLPIAGRVLPNLFERQDDPLYPPAALREALANAFCHRDYTIRGGSVGVAIFDDRLEVSSTGPLPFGLKSADLLKPHESMPWNPLIASVFYRRGIIEHWGLGIRKIVELNRLAGLPAPEIEEIPGAVIIRFRPSHYVAPERIGHNLSVSQRAILQVLSVNPNVRLGQIDQLTGMKFGLRKLRDDMLFLKKLGLVDLKGKGRGATWLLKNQTGNWPTNDG